MRHLMDHVEWSFAWLLNSPWYVGYSYWQKDGMWTIGCWSECIVVVLWWRLRDAGMQGGAEYSEWSEDSEGGGFWGVVWGFLFFFVRISIN